MIAFTPYLTSEDVTVVVRRFEACDFEAGGFHHSHHLTVAMCYLLELKETAAIAQMRTGLLQFLRKNGSPDAYHETITVFWIKRVRRFLDQADKARSLVDLANSVIEECCNTGLINDYFSAERLASKEARRKWIEPDLKPLETFTTSIDGTNSI